MSKILKIDVNVYTPQKLKSESGGEAKLQNKSVSITENKTTIVTPDSGYDGLSRVEVNTNVPNNPDWSQIGYSGTPQSIIDGFNYGKEIEENWNNPSSMSNLFSNDKKLMFFPVVDLSNATSLERAFYSCTALSFIILNNSSNATTLKGTFQDCTALANAEVDISSVTNMDNSFNNCQSLNSLTFTKNNQNAKITSMNSTFKNCVSLITAPELNTSLVTLFQNAYNSCTNLENVPEYNLTQVTNLSNSFANCNNLTNESLNNILASLLTATSYAGTKTLKNIGLTSSQSTACQSLSNWADLVNAGWTTGY